MSAGAAPVARVETSGKSLAARWVQLWDEREPPTLLACIRIALAGVVLFDLVQTGQLGITTWLWAPAEGGGISAWDPEAAPAFYRIFPGSADSAQWLWVALVCSMLCVGLGFFTRSAALLYVWLSAQTALINDPGDRAIDRAVRIVLLILALSPAGSVWSLDAKLKTGHFRGSTAPAPAWPRYLILGQLVLIYCGAGLAKGGTHWYPWGNYRALYLTLQDPILAAADFRWLARPVPYLLSQCATAVTHLWELAAPLVLLAAHCGRTRERPGRFRRLINALPVRNAYVGLGIAFHLTLAVTLQLGIFPFAMLACFPAFFRPEELEQASSSLRRALRNAALRGRGRRLPSIDR